MPHNVEYYGFGKLIICFWTLYNFSEGDGRIYPY